MELKEYLESKGIEGHEQGQNLVFDCPFCADDRQRCGININSNHAFFNSWNCFNCNERGKSIKSFQKAISKLNDEDVREKIEIRESEKENEQEFEIDQKLALKHFNKAQKPKRKALDYLRDERGFSKATIQHFMLGSRLKKKYEYVSIPFWENGELVNIKYRAIKFKDKKFKWLRITGGKTALFHDEAIDTMARKEIYICEAELDAMALWNAGIKNVIAMSAGAKHGIPHEWYDRVEKFENIYLVFDNDVDGQAGAEKMATRLGMDRCFNIVLPNDEIIEDKKKTKLKDLNQYFWDKDKKKDRNSIKKFKKLASASAKFQIKDVMSLTETFHELIKDKYTCNEDELLGFPSPWKLVNNILPSPKPGMFLVVTANPKVGKCEIFDSVVINPETMEPLTIEEAVKGKQKTIHSYNEVTKKIEVCKISDWVDSGVKPIIKVETKIGRSIETTYSHKYLTFNGWKPVSELRVGEKIAVPTRLGFFGENIVAVKKLHFIAGLIADGGLTGGGVLYTKKDKKLVSIMKDASISIFKTNMRQTTVKYRYAFTNGNNGGKGNNVLNECRRLGIDCLSKHKKIPTEIFTLKKELLAEFIGMLWSHDGSTYIKNGRTDIEYSSASEKLIDGLNHLLIRYGINLRKRYKKVKLNGEFFDSWLLESSQAETVERFFNEIPLYGNKCERKKIISNKMNRDYITSYPKEMWDVVKSEVSKSGSSMAQLWYKVIGYVPTNYTGHRFKIRGGCSKEMLIKINQYVKSELLKSFIESDISFVEVTKKEYIGEHQCYDLTVPKNENFLVNDVVAHNTTWVINYFLEIAGPDCPCHIECYEMRQKRIAEKTIAYAVTDYTSVEGITELQIREARFSNPSDHIFLGYPSDGDTSFEKLREKIIKVVQRYGVKLVCVDHLHFLVRGDNVKDKIGEVTRGLKVLAEMLGIVIILVAQPRKVENNRVPTPNDLKDSSSVFQDLDSLVILHRNLKTGDDFGKDSEEAKGKLESVTQVHVISRWGDGGQTLLYFKGQKSKYYEKGIGYDKEVGKFIEKRKGKHKRKKS